MAAADEDALAATRLKAEYAQRVYSASYELYSLRMQDTPEGRVHLINGSVLADRRELLDTLAHVSTAGDLAGVVGGLAFYRDRLGFIDAVARHGEVPIRPGLSSAFRSLDEIQHFIQNCYSAPR